MRPGDRRWGGGRFAEERSGWVSGEEVIAERGTLEEGRMVKGRGERVGTREGGEKAKGWGRWGEGCMRRRSQGMG